MFSGVQGTGGAGGPEGGENDISAGQPVEVHPKPGTEWKKQALDGLQGVFKKKTEKGKGDHEAQIKELHIKIEQLTVEWDFQQKPSGDEPQPEGRDGGEEPSEAQHHATVQVAWHHLFYMVLRARKGVSLEPAADAAHRRAVSEDTGLRRQADDEAPPVAGV